MTPASRITAFAAVLAALASASYGAGAISGAEPLNQDAKPATHHTSTTRIPIDD